MTIQTRNRVVLYGQPDGLGTGLEPLGNCKLGIGDGTDNTIPGSAVLYCRDDFGRPVVKVEYDEPPSGLFDYTLTFDKDSAFQPLLDQMRLENGRFGLWRFFVPAGRLSNYANWLEGGSLDYFAGNKITGGTEGGGPDKDFSATPIENSYNVSARRVLKLKPPVISALTTTETESINDITGISDIDPQDLLPGYPGQDQILFAVCDAATGLTANVLYSFNGGGVWAALGADPFAADEHIGNVVVLMTKPDEYRLIVNRLSTDAGNAAEIAYTDIIVGNEAVAPTWTTVDNGVTTGDVGEALLWPALTRLYSAASGDIYISSDKGESFGTAVYTGANAIAQFAEDFDKNVWAVGASNLIIREKAARRGTFETLVGPTGGGAFTSIAVARDKRIYAGNGSSIFINDNSAKTAARWIELKDFGTNHTVNAIQCIDGESQLLRAVVGDLVGGDGDVWISLDGGNSWTEVTNVANASYNAAFFSSVDPNLAFIVGEEDTVTGIIHKLSY